MANIVSHGTLGRIQPATRKQHVTEIHVMNVDLGEPDAGNHVKTNSIRQKLLIGIKDAKYNPYLSTVTFGKIASDGSINVAPVYKTLQQVMPSKKYAHLEERVYFAEKSVADSINKALVGISIHGIGYKPVENNPEQTEVRRWPRNWYGDNIKS